MQIPIQPYQFPQDLPIKLATDKPDGGDPDKYNSFDEFEKEFGEDVDCLKAYVLTDDGKNKFEELTKDGEYPLYKYLICDTITLNKLLEHMSNLKVVKYSKAKDFYEDIVNKEQSLYYMMADRGIKDAVNGAQEAGKKYITVASQLLGG